MKNLTVLAFGLCWASLVEAPATELSSMTNGVYLAMTGDHNDASKTNDTIRFDDRLVWMPFCDTGKVELFYPLDLAYGIKIKMTDSSGKDVEKTSAGELFGSKFDSLRNFRDTRSYPFVVEGSYKGNPHLGGGRFLPAPNELFVIEKPGIYTLELQMQMFLRRPQSTNAWHRELIQFPPVRMRVEKPPELRGSLK